MVRYWSSRNAQVVPRPGFCDERKLLGWIPAIFGENRKGGWSMMISALLEVENSWSDADPAQYYETKEEAQSAWDSASPVPMPHDLAVRCYITPDTLEMIHELGLYRSLSTDTEEEMEIEF